ncbi:MAG: right-handed parallel beta-helix repeat-containing protein [Verrucomicrobiota bacterium]
MNKPSPTIFNVRKAGAKGDGVSDDTSAFQSLLDLAGECEGTVEVPPGKYLLSSLKVRPHTAMVGYPTYAWKGCAGSVLELADPQATCLLDITLAIGARIDGLCLDGMDLGRDIHGILVDKPDYGHTEDSPLIERCKVTRFTGDGIRLSRIWCFRVRGNMCSNNHGHGLWVRGWDGFVLDNWLSMNRGAGYAALEENNAITFTGNRIEWNEQGGIVILNGSHYNITGNYIDRCAPGVRFEKTPDYIENPARIVGRVGYSTLTGNIFYRCGKPEWLRGRPGADCHLLLCGVRGLTITGNTFVAGRDDESNPGSLGYSSEPNWSPANGIVIEALRNVTIRDNVMDAAALQQLVVDLGGHGPGVVLGDNPGELVSFSE